VGRWVSCRVASHPRKNRRGELHEPAPPGRSGPRRHSPARVRSARPAAAVVHQGRRMRGWRAPAPWLIGGLRCLSDWGSFPRLRVLPFPAPARRRPGIDRRAQRNGPPRRRSPDPERRFPIPAIRPDSAEHGSAASPHRSRFDNGSASMHSTYP